MAISEKMRYAVRGLNRASLNAQDGISVVQIAEGALNETHSILQRMNELATQAANDPNTSGKYRPYSDSADYCNRDNTPWLDWLACASIDCPACARMLFLLYSTIADAISVSRTENWRGQNLRKP